MATVDAPSGCVMYSPCCRRTLVRRQRGATYTYQAWASVLLVQLYRAMREPLCVGRVTVRTPTLFSYAYARTLIRPDWEGCRAQKQAISMKKDELLKQGRELLTRIKKRTEYAYGMEFMKEAYMSDSDLEQLQAWFERVEEFVERFGLECQRERLSQNSWIINNGRVSEERIKNILLIIESIEER